jgi:hypothetical protein
MHHVEFGTKQLKLMKPVFPDQQTIEDVLALPHLDRLCGLGPIDFNKPFDKILQEYPYMKAIYTEMALAEPDTCRHCVRVTSLVQRYIDSWAVMGYLDQQQYNYLSRRTAGVPGHDKGKIAIGGPDLNFAKAALNPDISYSKTLFSVPHSAEAPNGHAHTGEGAWASPSVQVFPPLPAVSDFKSVLTAEQVGRMHLHPELGQAMDKELAGIFNIPTWLTYNSLGVERHHHENPIPRLGQVDMRKSSYPDVQLPVQSQLNTLFDLFVQLADNVDSMGFFRDYRPSSLPQPVIKERLLNILSDGFLESAFGPFDPQTREEQVSHLRRTLVALSFLQINLMMTRPDDELFCEFINQVYNDRLPGGDLQRSAPLLSGIVRDIWTDSKNAYKLNKQIEIFAKSYRDPVRNGNNFVLNQMPVPTMAA